LECSLVDDTKAGIPWSWMPAGGGLFVEVCLDQSGRSGRSAHRGVWLDLYPSLIAFGADGVESCWPEVVSDDLAVDVVWGVDDQGGAIDIEGGAVASGVCPLGGFYACFDECDDACGAFGAGFDIDSA